MLSASLLIIQGIDQGARFELAQSEIGVGRGSGNPVRLHDSEVSRTHARLHPVDGGFLITDQNSSNGTYVNGQAVRTRQLVNGDQIQIGRTVLQFSQQEAASAESSVERRVALVGKHDPDDRQNIVGQAGPDEADSVVILPSAAGRAEIAQTVANLQALYRIAEEAVRPSITIDQLLSRILEQALEVAGADRGCMLLRDPETRELSPQVFRHRNPADDSSRMPVSRTIVDYVLLNRQGVRTSDARSDQRFIPGQSILQGGIREAICVPMQGRYDLLGVIYLDTTTPPEQVILNGGTPSKFTEDLLRLMVAIGRQSALAVEDNRYQQALVKAERLAAVGQTIAILSHHIKNILQGVRGGSYLIDMGLKDHNEDLVRKGWGIVEKNQQKIYNLVMDMLSYGKERQPALRKADLHETLDEVCELLQGRAAEIHARIERRFDPSVPPVTFDTEGIHRAVLNILTNALDAVEGMAGDSPVAGETGDGLVIVQTGYDPATRTVFVSISDNGPGIPADQLASIFNLFESTKGSRGTGIGLPVSQKILREHGGEIVVESQVGVGSTFTLEWPVAEDENGHGLDQTMA